MSLATRCTACGTVFRVVQDQLKVSEGWVRCGRCDQVFNAIEGLFDLERDAPPHWVPPAAPPAPPAAAVTATFQQQPAEPPQDEEEVFHLSDEDRIHSRFFMPEQDDVDKTPAQSRSTRDKRDFADAQFNDALLGDDGLPIDPTPPLPPQPAVRASRKKRSKGPSPEFLRAAKARARWRSPWMRAALSLSALMLTAVLAGQVAYQFRDLLAARHDALRPLLAQGCEWLHCQIELPQRIDDFTVESSALAPANGGAAYRLSVVLRNRGDLTLALPAVDLSLTDANGEMVSRRALTAADFRVTNPALAANSEVSLQLVLATEGRRVSGYTVEIFYP